MCGNGHNFWYTYACATVDDRRAYTELWPSQYNYEYSSENDHIIFGYCVTFASNSFHNRSRLVSSLTQQQPQASQQSTIFLTFSLLVNASNLLHAQHTYKRPTMMLLMMISAFYMDKTVWSCIGEHIHTQQRTKWTALTRNNLLSIDPAKNF